MGKFKYIFRVRQYCAVLHMSHTRVGVANITQGVLVPALLNKKRLAFGLFRHFLAHYEQLCMSPAAQGRHYSSGSCNVSTKSIGACSFKDTQKYFQHHHPRSIVYEVLKYVVGDTENAHISLNSISKESIAKAFKILTYSKGHLGWPAYLAPLVQYYHMLGSHFQCVNHRQMNKISISHMGHLLGMIKSYYIC